MKKIPQKYHDEYMLEEITATKFRLRIFALLFVSVFTGGSIVFNLLAAETISSHLIETWIVSIAACMILLLLSKKAPNMKVIKVSAFFLIAVLLFMLASGQIYAGMQVYAVMVTYLFLFLSISLIVPWHPAEVVLVGLLTAGAFTLYFTNAHTVDPVEGDMRLELIKYMQGAVMLFLTYLVCFFVRRRETDRDISNFLLLKEIEEGKEQMQKELDQALRVHGKLIPRSITTDSVDIAVTYLPVCYLGGDYANYRILDEKDLIFFIGDVTGHGVSAALLVNAVHAEIENLFKEGKTPGAILMELGKRIFSSSLEKTDMMLTAFCGYLDYDRMKLVYSNYGHPQQYLYHTADSLLEPLGSQTGMIGSGVGSDNDIYQSEVTFAKGDQVILFTDGITEAKSEGGEDFGYKGLEAFIKKHNKLYVNVFNEKLLHELITFTSNNFHDDIFILNIRTK